VKARLLDPEHFKHPYPTPHDQIILMHNTGIILIQYSSRIGLEMLDADLEDLEESRKQVSSLLHPGLSFPCQFSAVLLDMKYHESVSPT